MAKQKSFYLKIIFSFLLLFSLYGVAKSQWVRSNGIYDERIMNIGINQNYIYACTNRFGLFVSSNNGESWLQKSFANIFTFSILVNNNYILLSASSGYGVCRSTNNCETWTTVLHFNGYQFFCDFAVSGNNVFAGENNMSQGVFRSTNNGINWSQTSLNNKQIFSLLIDGNTIFAGTNGQGIYTSTNNGDNWIQSTLNNQKVWSIAKSGSYIYAGTYDSGLYRSTNSGVNWSRSGLYFVSGFTIIRTIQIINNKIIAGVDDKGLFLSTNNGVNWTEFNQGFNAIPAVFDLAYNNTHNFVGTYNQGLWRRPLSDFIGINNITNEIPTKFSLAQNFPNPFNPKTNIRFDIPTSSFVKVRVYDIRGKEIHVLVNERLQAGTYQTDWDASAYPSGVYFYRMVTDGFSETRKMSLVK